MWKYVGDGQLLLGLPARDMDDDEWGSYPRELRDAARKHKLYEKTDNKTVSNAEVKPAVTELKPAENAKT